MSELPIELSVENEENFTPDKYEVCARVRNCPDLTILNCFLFFVFLYKSGSYKQKDIANVSDV